MTFGGFDQMLVWQLFLRVALPSLYFLDFRLLGPMLMFCSCTVSNLRDEETLTNHREAYYVELLGVIHRIQFTSISFTTLLACSFQVLLNLPPKSQFSQHEKQPS